ncbi:MAG: helix-turn-helix domain-containing protein [Rickettsiales bacterium]|jgi:transcriptional regulator with XRE-family HTH domain|nr:helix-turn-helix domain-containing protein [Rickettsiales bacterium]MDR1260902.1 helix-turn-helix domain-containing protein [Rickettsiales bacterium]
MAIDTIDYEVGKKLKYEREIQEYTQASLGSEVGVTEKQMSRYERGENPTLIITILVIIIKLGIDSARLLPQSTVPEGAEVKEALSLVRECKKFRNYELCKMASALNKSMQIGEEEGKKAGKITVAKNLLEAGVSLDVIFQTTGLSAGELKKHCRKEIVNFVAYEIGKKIKERRLERGYTQEELGSRVGLTSKQIQHYEQGISLITTRKLHAIAEALSVNIKSLLPEISGLLKISGLPKISELIEKGNIEVERNDEDKEREKGVLDLVREFNKIEDEEIRDKFHSLMMSVSKKIQIDKEKGKKIEEIEVAKNLLEVGVPINVIQQATGLQDLKAI